MLMLLLLLPVPVGAKVGGRHPGEQRGRRPGRKEREREEGKMLVSTLKYLEIILWGKLLPHIVYVLYVARSFVKTAAVTYSLKRTKVL